VTFPELVKAGVSLLQHTEVERAAFVASLEEAEAEGARNPGKRVLFFICSNIIIAL
jgi:hypothetical protein